MKLDCKMLKKALEEAEELLVRSNPDYGDCKPPCQLWVYPIICPSTNPFGGIGGQTITKFTMTALEGELGDGVLILGPRRKYVRRFKPLMGWEEK